MGSFIGGFVALVVGAGLAAASVIGVVQLQSGDSSEGAPASQVVDYGTNADG